MFSIITKAGHLFKSLQKTKVFHYVFLALLVSSFLQVLIPQTVLAKGEQYSWIDKKTIRGSGGAYNGNVTFVQSGTEPQGYVRFSTEYIKITGSDCPRYIITLKTQPASNPDNAGVTWSSPAEDGCRTPANNILDRSVTIGNVANATKEPGSESPSNTQTGDVNRDGKIDEADKIAADPNANDSGENASCESEGGEMSWILCPLLRQADNIVEKLDRTINSLLQVPNRYFEGQAGDNLRATWARLRNIAFIILIPIMLVMVISTAAGSNMFDAYTVKKALPRLFAAVLFMALSFDLCIFMVTFINEVGSGFAGLITSSFGGVESITLASLFDPHLASGAAATGAGIFGFGLLLIAGPGVIGSFALVTVVALIIGFVVLSIRQVLIIFLILFSPLAILAWIFPGNDKLWKLWWGSFSKLLLLYPLVVGLIAFGKVFAKLVDQSLDVTTQDAQSGLPDALLKLVAYIGPYFFIPATFKLAGGLFATITGAVNDKSRGFFDKQRKKRAEGWKHRKELAGSEGLFSRSHTNPFLKGSAKFGNKLTTWTANPYKNAAYASRNKNIPFLSRKGQFLAAGVEEAAIEQNKKLFQKLNEAGANDKTFRTLAGAHSGLKGNVTYQGQRMRTSEAFARAGLSGKNLSAKKDLDLAADILKTSDDHTERLASGVLHRVAPVVGNTHNNPELTYADTATAGLFGMAAHGFYDGDDLEEVGAIMTKNSGLHYADNAVTIAEVIGAQHRPDTKAGYGHAIQNGKIVNGITKGGRGWDLLGTLDPGSLSRAKTGSIKALAPFISEMYQAADNLPAYEKMWEMQGFSDEQIAKRRNTIKQKSDVIKNELINIVGPYSQAPVDTQAEARVLIEKLGFADKIPSYDSSVAGGVQTMGDAAQAQPGGGIDAGGINQDPLGGGH